MWALTPPTLLTALAKSKPGVQWTNDESKEEDKRHSEL